MPPAIAPEEGRLLCNLCSPLQHEADGVISGTQCASRNGSNVLYPT